MVLLDNIQRFAGFQMEWDKIGIEQECAHVKKRVYHSYFETHSKRRVDVRPPMILLDLIPKHGASPWPQGKEALLLTSFINYPTNDFYFNQKCRLKKMK